MSLPPIVAFGVEHFFISAAIFIAAFFGARTLRHAPGINVVALFGYTFITGLFIAPSLFFAQMMASQGQALDPSPIRDAFLLTGAAFTGLTGYVFITKKDFSFLGASLSMGLWVFARRHVARVLPELSGAPTRDRERRRSLVLGLHPLRHVSHLAQRRRARAGERRARIVPRRREPFLVLAPHPVVIAQSLTDTKAMRFFHALSAVRPRVARLVMGSVGVAIAGFSPAAHAAPLTRGFAIVALDGAKDVASPLARAVYSRPSLRPDASLDEPRAHVLLGEPATTPLPAMNDLASSRAAIKGDDAPSRQLLSNIAADFHLRGVVVVSCATSDAAPSTWSGASSSPAPADVPPKPPVCNPTARLFLATNGKTAAHFEADAITPDLILDPTQPVTWNAAVLGLDSQYGVYAAVPKPVPAGALSATPSQEKKKEGSHYFYESPWFWGALGAAAFAGTAVFLATRDNSGDTIHLQMQVP